MLEIIKELFNYGVLGIFAGFVLWGVVKGCRAVYEVLFSPGNPEKGIPKGLLVRLVDHIQIHLERLDTSLDRTAGVMERTEQQIQVQHTLCQSHVENMEMVSLLLSEQKESATKISGSLQRLVELHESPENGSLIERTNRKLHIIQLGMLEACTLCKKLASKFNDPSIEEITNDHCDAIIKAISEERELVR